MRKSLCSACITILPRRRQHKPLEAILLNSLCRKAGLFILPDVRQRVRQLPCSARTAHSSFAGVTLLLSICGRLLGAAVFCLTARCTAFGGG